MALSQEERQIAEYGAKSGKTKEEISNAISKYRVSSASNMAPEQANEPKDDRSFLKKTGDAVKDYNIGGFKGAVNTLQNVGNVIAKPLGNAFGVPEQDIGFSKEALTPKNTAQKVGKFVEQVGEFLIPGTAVSKATTGLPRIAKIAANVASDVGVTAAQQGNSDGLVTTGVVSTTLSSIPLVGKLLKGKTATFTGDVAQNLEKINLRLTPPQKLDLKKSQNGVIQYLTQKKVTGSPEARFDKIVSLYDDFENKIQTALKTSGKKYTKEEIIDSVRKIPDIYLEQVDNPEVYDQMQRIVKRFENFVNIQNGDFIAATRVNAFKRSYAKNARNKAGDSVINESREAISDGLYELLQRDIDQLKPLNGEYSKIIMAKKLLGKAIGRNELGLIGNLISAGAGSAVGGSIGGAVGGAAGFLAGPAVATAVAGTNVRSRIGSGLQGLSEYLQKAAQNEAGDFIIPRSVIEALMSGGGD